MIQRLDCGREEQLLAIGIIVVIIVRAILGLVGEILDLIVGSFRLRIHFINSTYGTAGVPFMVDIFVPFLSIEHFDSTGLLHKHPVIFHMNS